MDRQQIQVRWNEIVNAMVAAGVPRDELSLLAIVVGAELLSARYERMVVREQRPIGFAPPARKEER